MKGSITAGARKSESDLASANEVTMSAAWREKPLNGAVLCLLADENTSEVDSPSCIRGFGIYCLRHVFAALESKELCSEGTIEERFERLTLNDAWNLGSSRVGNVRDLGLGWRRKTTSLGSASIEVFV